MMINMQLFQCSLKYLYGLIDPIISELDKIFDRSHVFNFFWKESGKVSIEANQGKRNEWEESGPS